MRYRFELRNATGEICCAGNEPDFPRCPSCRARHTPSPTVATVARLSTHVERRTASEWRDYFGLLVQGYGSVVTELPPDPYRAASERAPYVPEPTDDPNYQPHGTPPDSYALALAARKLNAMRKDEFR